MDTSALAEAIGIVLGVSMILGRIVGPVVMYLVDAIKGTGLIPSGYAGILGIVLSVLLAVPAMVLVDGLTPSNQPTWVLLLLGAFAGLVIAADAVKEYKAAGDVNTGASQPTIIQHQPEPGVVIEGDPRPASPPVRLSQ